MLNQNYNRHLSHFRPLCDFRPGLKKIEFPARVCDGEGPDRVYNFYFSYPLVSIRRLSESTLVPQIHKARVSEPEN
jgi:hypothetical protein